MLDIGNLLKICTVTYVTDANGIVPKIVGTILFVTNANKIWLHDLLKIELFCCDN